MLQHGGRLKAVAKEYDMALDDWIDLSTGINPYHWPIPELPTSAFTRLPEDDDGLMQAVLQYYKSDLCLPVAGSQAAIQMLPRCRKKSTVAVPETGYAEHAWQWQSAGHDVVFYNEENIDSVINNADVAIIINPNNPTAKFYSPQQLLRWYQTLQSRQGWLIIDEAFIDCEQNNSLLGQADKPGLIVLRSVGKFFGLAGIRSGFVFADTALLEKMHKMQGPWALTGVSRLLTKMALLDTDWQDQAKQKLQTASAEFQQIIKECSGFAVNATQLFVTIFHPQAEQLYRMFAEHAVLVRLLDNKQGIRLGLADDTQQEQVCLVIRQVFDAINNERPTVSIKTA
ncbi:MAG: threonine-phosphate decarboxylase CobD [Gammaproteobacteria bacterium]|nr:threonine-phosphate decarboxylase CobD [Gammaproteobacteria bacterium]